MCKSTRLIFSGKQCASHGLELPDLFPEDLLGDLEVFRQAGEAVAVPGAAVDHFAGKAYIILGQGGAAADAAGLIHGPAPGGRGRAAYRVPGR